MGSKYQVLVVMFLCLIFFVAKSFATSTPEQSWKWSGDLRYRVAKSKEDIDEERNFQQLRARLGFKVEVQNDLSAKLRLATGSSAISTNQTLGDSKEPGMARRNFGIDLAYGDWEFIPHNHLWLGRTENPFWAPGKNQMVFDSDLSFEGLAFKHETSWDAQKLQLNLGSSVISENFDSTSRQDVVDSGVWGAQINFESKLPVGSVKMHYSQYEYVNIQDKNITSFDSGAKTDVYSTPYDRYRGNSVYRPDPAVANYFFSNKYRITSQGLEWKFSDQDAEVVVFYDQSMNQLVDSQNIAKEFGITLRSGRVTAAWVESVKESDSVVGAFSDSDMSGGGTDTKGQKLSVAYQLSKDSNLALTTFRARRGVNSVERDFVASQFDLAIVF